MYCDFYVSNSITLMLRIYSQQYLKKNNNIIDKNLTSYYYMII